MPRGSGWGAELRIFILTKGWPSFPDNHSSETGTEQKHLAGGLQTALHPVNTPDKGHKSLQAGPDPAA